MKKLFLLVALFFAVPSHASQFDTPVHRLGLFMVGAGHYGDDFYFDSHVSAVGISVLSYEYISRWGWAINLAPLGVYAWEGIVDYDSVDSLARYNRTTFHTKATDYVPVWLRHYFGGEPKHNWFFLSLGYDFHQFSRSGLAEYNYDAFGNVNGITPDRQETEKRTLAYELGIDFGERLFNRGMFAVKIFPGSSTAYDRTIIYLTYGFSFGWAGG